MWVQTWLQSYAYIQNITFFCNLANLFSYLDTFFSVGFTYLDCDDFRVVHLSLTLTTRTLQHVIKASEMLVAPRISECFDLSWSALVCYSLLTSSFAPFGRSGRYVCLHHPESPFFLLFFWLFIFLLVFFLILFVCFVGLFV